MMYRVCLERGLYTNAKELVARAYHGEGRDNSSASLRVWMHATAATGVKPEPKESAPSGGVSAQVPALSGGADAKGGETPPKKEDK